MVFSSSALDLSTLSDEAVNSLSANENIWKPVYKFWHKVRALSISSGSGYYSFFSLTTEALRSCHRFGLCFEQIQITVGGKYLFQWHSEDIVQTFRLQERLTIAVFWVWNLNMYLIFCEQVDESSASTSLAQLMKVYTNSCQVIKNSICFIFLNLRLWSIAG